MKVANGYYIVPYEDQPLMDQEPATDYRHASSSTYRLKDFTDEKRMKRKRKNRVLICCSNVEMAVLDEEGEEHFGHDGEGKWVAPGLVLGERSCLVTCFSNLEVGTKPKSADR